MIKKFNTPIVKIKLEKNYNNIYMKRDDLIPFSFGGNKVRIAYEFLEDMKLKNYTSIISYGSSKSNLNRAVSNLARANNINCYIVSPVDNEEKEESYNKELCLFSIPKDNIFNSEVINVRKTIEKVIEISKNKDEIPYYINGKSDGTGNELIPIKAYEKCYEEILEYEKENNIYFDYICHASGTGMTQAGLICGMAKNKDTRRTIVGISIARKKEHGEQEIKRYLEAKQIDLDKINIEFVDKYLCGGYGKYSHELIELIRKVYKENGIPLDLTYTGKGFLGMKKYLNEKDIKNKNILFVHTGGTPLFFEDINKVGEENKL